MCPKGQCVNTEGSFYCHCEDGYRNVEGACVDINECEEGVVCPQQCINSEGSHECGCWEGYTLIPESGGSCSDIDECNLHPAICEQGCTNLAGGFECTCSQGHSPHPEDTTKCVRTGCQPLDAPEGGRLTCSNGPLKPGSLCRLNCNRGFILRGQMARTCMENGEWEEGAGQCIETSCPPIPPLDNGDILPQTCLTDNHHFKQRCATSCREGFNLEGSGILICGKRGRWVKRQGRPKCIPEATSPPQPVDKTSPVATRPPQPVDQVAPPPSTPPPTQPTSSRASPYIICPSDILVNLTEAAPYQVLFLVKLFRIILQSINLTRV